jgi:sulfur-carrier protein adenylyltransferase/sulfurtransferase
VLIGTGEPLVGRLLVYDALEMSYRDIKVRKDPECPICGKNPTITELQDYEAFCGVISDEAMHAAQGSTLTASELAEMRSRGEKFVLVDVREPAEFEIVRIPDSVLIPKGELPSRMSELPLDQPVILYCKSGVRSAESLAVLKAAGFSTAKHVQGGVTAWSLQVDRSLPVY